MPAEDRGEILDPEEYAKKGYMGGAGDKITVETDQFEAAAKKHKLREQAQREKTERRKKLGLMKFKEDEENPYDSEEKDYEQNHHEDEKF